MPIASVTTDGNNATINSTIWENVEKDFQTQINNKVNISDFVLISGTYNAPSSVNEIVINLDYPTGFNKNNCIPFIVGTEFINNRMSFGSTLDVASTAQSGLLSMVSLSNEKINIRAINYYSGSAHTLSGNIDYKLLLMKISE